MRPVLCRLEERHEELSSLLAEEFEAEEGVLDECQRSFLELPVKAKGHIHVSDTGPSRRENGRGGAPDEDDSKIQMTLQCPKVSDSMTHSSLHAKFNVARPSLPTFSGDVREYYEFKSDFKYLVESDFSSWVAVTFAVFTSSESVALE